MSVSSPETSRPSNVDIATDLGDTRWHRSTRLFWVIALALVCLAWWHSTALIASNEARELEIANKDLANITRLADEHASRTFRSADFVTKLVRQRYAEQGDKLNLSALEKSGLIDTDIFNQVGVIDAKGIYKLANVSVPERLSLGDREHFKVHIDAKGDDIYISKPVLGRVTRKWSIQLTRRITAPNGEFGGVVVVSIDVGYFTRFYGDLNLGHNGLAALYAADGIALARRVGNEDKVGQDARASHVFDQVSKGVLAGSFARRSVVDGTERLFNFRKIPHYPLIVVAGRDMQDLLQSHQQSAHALRLQSLVMSLLIVVLTFGLTRYFGRIKSEVHERHLAQLRVQDRTEQLNAIFSLSPDGFVTFDRSHCVKYGNPAFAQMLAQDAPKLEGLHEDDFSAWLDSRCTGTKRFPGVASMRGDPAQRIVISVDKKAPKFIEISSRNSESRSVSQILYFRDISHQFEVDRMKSEFMSIAAHELRTPMASIYGFAEVLLAQEVDADSLKEYVGIIHEQSKNVSKILDDLLDIARIEARRGIDFHRVPLDVNALVKEALKLYRWPDDRPPPVVTLAEKTGWVIADQGKLRQVIFNVLSNAYKYSAAGSPVRVEVETPLTPTAPQTCAIKVTDVGIGMTPAQLQRICERFYRADTSGKVSGTGLGMSIVKEIVELHEGRVDIQSVFGQGTTVTITLPLKAAPST